MIDLIERPRQKREQVAHDSRKNDGVAEGCQYPLCCVFQREHPFPDHNEHHDGKKYITQDICCQQRRGVAVKHLVGNFSCRLHIAVFLKCKLEDQRHIHEHSMDIAPADRAGEIGDLKQLDPFLLLRLGEMHLQELPHLVKTDVIERRSKNTADDADYHAPCCHIKIGDLAHQPDGFRALGFPGRRKQKVADHIERAPNHARNKRSLFFAHFHCLSSNPIFTICIFIIPSPILARNRKKLLTDGSRRSL